jgi:phosphoribosylformimino-5-aminoimidazole carboxamide ribotide isomerase
MCLYSTGYRWYARGIWIWLLFSKHNYICNSSAIINFIIFYSLEKRKEKKHQQMKIFPAIDIKDKKCVRLIKGDFNNKTEYEISPVDQAGKYKDHGFKNLHIVDLDGALTGETVNLDTIKEIVRKFDLKIEVGGGVRTIDSIKKYVDAGVEKVILGSAAIKDKNFLKEACQKFPNKIALGLDAKDGYLSVSGWKENSNQLTLDFLKEVNDYGASRLIYTDINRDGTKQSPNFEETSKVAEISNCPVIISGGVSSIDDIKKAKSLKNNIEGIIVGKAIYDGDIKLEELVREIDA